MIIRCFMVRVQIALSESDGPSKQRKGKLVEAGKGKTVCGSHRQFFKRNAGNGLQRR